ncbi:MAG: response regulator [Thermoproteota archaeon]|nr:response regulator [Thermoproteota archaeon]MDQ3882477.1 response regulator [Thermoproteota archaeon]
MSSTHSILVVDDELDIVLIFKQALSRQGYTVFGFTDPLLALEHFKANSTDYGLVITDVRMPRMSGFELAAKIKVIKPDAKVVFMSAFEISDLEFSIPGIKINDFLRKPVDVKTLVRRVKVAMGN